MHDPATRRGVIAMSIAMGLFITNDALVKLDATFSGNETGFCAAYKNNQYAPDLR